MTTIAAAGNMMAADWMVNVGETAIFAGKLWRAPDGALIGCAGHNEACTRFFDWWVHRRKSRLAIPRRFEFEALVLSHEGLFLFEHTGMPDIVKDGIAAIGVGQEQAMAALDTMKFLKRRPDPRIAVMVACKRNPMSGGGMDYARLKKAKG
jgi:hypothetical protein